MKHKHYECIVAWAEGKQVQFCRDGGEWFDCEPHTNLSLFPNFSLDYSYRIKPVKSNWIQQYRVDEHGIIYLSGVANLRLYFDGDGHLTAAAVLR
jgi:hypothetical protein